MGDLDITKSKETGDDINAVPISKGSFLFDAKAYKGLKIKIRDVRVIETIDWYTGEPDTKGRPTYNPDSKELCKKVEIETYPLPQLDEDGNPIKDSIVKMLDVEGNEKEIVVKRRFNLKKELVDGKVTWTISENEKAALWNFMQKQRKGMTKLGELKDTIVLLDAVPDPDPKNEKYWLRIN